ncbi:ABC transporter permease [Candidatus Clostridium stratigraminis]|uniref:ABC transporter permease n=1 Tax=Candidatus Clostridium stratigraminis TaxID=3381661 RepID=A0ABW8T4N8_9CLOT
MDIFNNLTELRGIITMSLLVSISSTLIASFFGILIGIPSAIMEFRFKKILIRITNTLMSLPPVLMGLVTYMLLSRSGPLGNLRLLFTPTAMIVAQTLLIFPIIFGLVLSSIANTGSEIKRNCLSLGASDMDILITIFKESRVQILTAVTAGFGRAISEVGAVMMVGGNIKGYTRVMTTYIALETGKGNFSNAIIIGVILLLISFGINFILHKLQGSDG